MGRGRPVCLRRAVRIVQGVGGSEHRVQTLALVQHHDHSTRTLEAAYVRRSLVDDANLAHAHIVGLCV